MAHNPVTGHHRPDGPIHHWDGWNAAIEHALAQTGWDRGTHNNVKVELTANIEVVNPGRIVEYVVTLTPPGP